MSKTEITVDAFDSDWRVAEVTCTNPDSPGWNQSQRTWQEPVEFDEEGISAVDAIFETALYRGWREEAYYQGGEHVLSEVARYQDGRETMVPVETEHAGCLLGLLNALRHTWRKRRLAKRTIVILPMLERR